MGHATTTTTTTTNNSPFPGFTKISGQIYIHHPDRDDDNTAANAVVDDESQPDTVIIYGWGDGRPRDVSKYIQGYRVLYPQATIIAVLATTFKAAYRPLHKWTEGMTPAFSDTDQTNAEAAAARASPCHVECGRHQFGVDAQRAHLTRYGTPVPHRVMVLDSVPGGLVFHQQVERWSRAMGHWHQSNSSCDDITPVPGVARP
ncbi:hypothetical protein PG993_000875 [Apiospora rasikravindrae]|uniref:Uncharacterized protein n=1 Tax=Apiospora rasikravindrae TaxID=990691 RepID=A0ABR1U9U1_9PEZI